MEEINAHMLVYIFYIYGILKTMEFYFNACLSRPIFYCWFLNLFCLLVCFFVLVVFVLFSLGDFVCV